MANHLTLEDKINQGSFYTPMHLVNILNDMIDNYMNKTTTKKVIFDAGVGNGAFIDRYYLKKRFIGIDIDEICIDKVKELYPLADVYKGTMQEIKEKVYEDISNRECKCPTLEIYHYNALTELTRSRDMLNIENTDDLIVVGNPPFNDITSQNKMLIKDGFLKADDDIKTRDLGITFMRMYARLQPKAICIIHPLSYLNKKSNFNLLKEFKDNYKLKESIIFSSSEFEDTSKTEFPITISLYVKDEFGMDYEYISNFKFDILNSNDKFCINDFTTTDGIIHKYPNQNKEKDNGLYFHTFRDNNSIKRSATFRSNKTKSSIFVNIDELYKYCYLDWYKDNYDDLLKNIEYKYIFGNLSPLLFDNYFLDKKFLVNYSYNNNKEFRKVIDNDKNIKKEIEDYYNIKFQV